MTLTLLSVPLPLEGDSCVAYFCEIDPFLDVEKVDFFSMPMFFYLSLLFTIFHFSISKESVAHRIAFGSCYNPNKGDEIWRLIRLFSPNQLILLGDQIYADFHPIYEYMHMNGSNPDIIRVEYDKLYSQKGFNNLLSSLSHGWVSTYDDHDYGKNNGDRTYKFRDEAIALFAEYNSPFHYVDSITLPDLNTGELRTEKKTGVFSSHTYTFPVYQDKTKSIFRYKVLLLDTRSNKDKTGAEKGDFLGEQQWRWLQYELSEQALVDVDLVLLGSGVQILPDDKLVEESWNEFPQQRERLLSLLSQLSLTRNILMLSGDIHSAEINQMTCLYQDGTERQRQEEWRLIELTSSGLSHSVTQLMDLDRMMLEKQKRSDVDMPHIITKTRSVFVEFFIAMYQFFYPAVYREDKYHHAYLGLHFGLIDFIADDEGSKIHSLRFQTINHQGNVVMSLDIPLKPRHTSNLFHESEARIDCKPIRGTLSPFQLISYKTKLALGVVALILLPSLMLLWFVCATIYYIIVKVTRRKNYEHHSQEKKKC